MNKTDSSEITSTTNGQIPEREIVRLQTDDSSQLIRLYERDGFVHVTNGMDLFINHQFCEFDPIRVSTTHRMEIECYMPGARNRRSAKSCVVILKDRPVEVIL